MVAGYSFRPRLWVVAAAALGCAAGIALAQWQAGRAEEKRADVLEVPVEDRPLEPGAVHDLADGQLGEGALADELDGRVDDVLARSGAADPFAGRRRQGVDTLCHRLLR